MRPTQLEIRLLGRFQVLRDGEAVRSAAFDGRLARLLVRVLAIQRGSLVPRDVLADILWGERPPADPDANLDVLVHRARRALGDASLIITGLGGYALADGDGIWIDAEQFRASVRQGREHAAVGDHAIALGAFRRALDVWRGEPLAEDVYADWAEGWRRELLALQLEALEGGAGAALFLDAAHHAAQLAEMAIVREPLRESPRLLLVKALARVGDSAGALRVFDEYARTLAGELGVEPSPEAINLRGTLLGPGRQPAAERAPDLATRARRTTEAAHLGGQGSAPKRALTLAAMAAVAAGSDDYRRGERLARLTLLEAGDDRPARAEALVIASVVDMNLGRFKRSGWATQKASPFACGIDARRAWRSATCPLRSPMANGRSRRPNGSGIASGRRPRSVGSGWRSFTRAADKTPNGHCAERSRSPRGSRCSPAGRRFNLVLEARA